MAKKKILPEIKAPSHEVAEILETDARNLLISWDINIYIGGHLLSLRDGSRYLNYFDALVDIRKLISGIYVFLNANLGTHYVVKNDTESNLKDIGY